MYILESKATSFPAIKHPGDFKRDFLIQCSLSTVEMDRNSSDFFNCEFEAVDPTDCVVADENSKPLSKNQNLRKLVFSTMNSLSHLQKLMTFLEP